jgi:predicted nucleotidyltransferase
MQLTQHASANEVLRDLIEWLRIVFADQVVSVYLYGSVVAGDFDPDRSDLDFVVACSFDVEARLHDLEQLHRDLAVAHPSWDDRVDVIYVPVAALRSFGSRPSRTAFISPGEPLHLTDTSQHIINWYLLQEQGLTLLGPPPPAVMPTITHDEFLAEVRAHLLAWPRWISLSDQPGFHAYAVLTICRALHVCRCSRQTSKRQAALWAQREYPQWSGLIEHSLAWRRQPSASNPAPRAVEFVNFAVREVAGSHPVQRHGHA